MRYISVCSGIEAATVAWHHMGWTPAWFSEIEPFPSAVLKHHFPSVPNVGDMTKHGEWPDEPVDLLVGGTPCQSFSVAGLRKGLSDPRGGLMLTYLEIARRYRPRWVVWENVPGVLSSNGGRDFGSFLGALGDLGFGWAYRVLDAQWFGVAQRRRRVFVVGHFGNWERAAKVLFESESVCRDTPPSREARKDFTGSTGDGVARCVTAGEMKRQDWETCNMIAQPVGVPDVMATLLSSTAGISRPGNAVTEHETYIPMAIPIHDQATRFAGKRGDKQDGKGNGFGVGASGDPAPTLTKTDRHGVAQPVAFAQNQLGEVRVGEVTNTLNTNSNASGRNTPMVAQPYVGGVDYENNAHTMDEPTGPLLKGSPTGGGRPLPAIATAMQVRRLTPVECERLQGFPDGYTNIPWRKAQESPDGPRYKALGNSMAVPVMRWIGERINKVDNE